MNRDEHAEQRRLVQESLRLSPDESERHNTYPRQTRRRCPNCTRSLYALNGGLMCANANCTYDDPNQLRLPTTTEEEA